MRLIIGAGIDDRDLAPAYDVADGTSEGERARIVTEDSADPGADFVDDAGFERKVAIERDVVVVGHGGARVVSRHPEVRALASLEGWRAPPSRLPSRRARKGAHLRMTCSRL